MEEQFILHKETSLFMEPTFPGLQVMVMEGQFILIPEASILLDVNLTTV